MALNQVTLLGNLGADPELIQTQSGRSMLRITLAVDDYIYRAGAAEGERVRDKRTDWFTVVAWGAQAEANAKYLKKGARVTVSGSLRSHTWKDNNGQNHFSVEVHADPREGITWLNLGQPSKTEREQNDIVEYIGTARG